jgi:phosphatidate cytidylyltransferase
MGHRVPSAPDPALPRRVLSAFVLLPLALLPVALGGWAFLAMLGGLIVVLAWEWRHLTAAVFGSAGGDLAGASALLAALAALLLAGLGHGTMALAALLSLAVLVALAARLLGHPGRWVAAGVLYFGLPAVALVWLRDLPGMGLVALVWLLIVVWSTDIAAYFVGRRIGGPRLAPRISPGKTWAGFAGGVAGASLASALFALALGSTRLPYAALLGALLSVVAQVGDLAESALKRRAGVKDTGAMIPGHGGILDRLDSLLFAAPVLALFALLLGPGAWPWR